MDVMPTILDLAGVTHPAPHFRDRSVVPMRGKSWVPLLAGQTSAIHNATEDFTAWELFGCRAVRQGKWKALLMPTPRGSGEWELYDLEEDPGEVRDRAKRDPEVLGRLIRYVVTVSFRLGSGAGRANGDD